MELKELLNRTADQIVVIGTLSQSQALHRMAAAAWDLNRGAAAALEDWNGSEIARLRAFGIVHGILLRDLPDSAQEELLTDLLAASSAVVPEEEPAMLPTPQTRSLGYAAHTFNWSRLIPVKRLWQHAHGAPE